MTERLRDMEPLHADEHFVRECARIINAGARKVCEDCGLQITGHGAESQWLGHPAHPWTPRKAKAGDIDRARTLSRLAYRKRAQAPA